MKATSGRVLSSELKTRMAPGRSESVPNELDLPEERAAASDADDVEAHRTLVETELAHELARGALDLELLAPLDRLERGAEPVLRARLHLDEDERVAVERDDVDLAVVTAIVPAHDGVAAPAQIARGRALSARSQELPNPWHRSAVHLTLKRRNAHVTSTPMALARDQVRHIAMLARLELTAEEEATFGDQLAAILEYIETLQEIDTTGVEPTAHVVDTENPLRDDEVTNAPQVERMLANAPDRDGDLFKVPKIIE